MNSTKKDEEAIELEQINITMNLEADKSEFEALVEDLGSYEDSSLCIVTFAPCIIIFIATVLLLLVPMFL